MALPTAYSNYKDNSIMTASPGQLTLMLYEGAIKFCNMAIIALERNDIQKANINIQKTERIIEEFRATLNFDYPVAKDFDKIYDYIYRRLIEANVSKNANILQEVLVHLRTVRDTWKEVMNRTNH